jgi:hypothetical protein
MGHHLALGGEAHLVSRGQISGRCIHHAPVLGIPFQSSKFLIAIAVIEAPFGALLVAATRSPLLGGAHDRRAWIRAVQPAAAAASAKNQTNAATRAVSLDTELEHRNQLRKVGCRASIDDPAQTSAAHYHECSYSNLKARSGELRAFVLWGWRSCPDRRHQVEFLAGTGSPLLRWKWSPIRPVAAAGTRIQ